MEPYDPPEAYSVNSYRSRTPGSYKPFNWKKLLHSVVLGALIGMVALLLYVNHHQAQTIAIQRHLILDMYRYILTQCSDPTVYAN